MKLDSNDSVFRSKCPISCALDLIGDKWTLLIMRDAILLKQKTFGEFRNSSEKIASNILTDRLNKLVSNGVMTKTQNAQNKLIFNYELTERGQELKPILFALFKWGSENVMGSYNNEVAVKTSDNKRNEV
jgi:DNA-binding HxlR family transcriptional regulator